MSDVKHTPTLKVLVLYDAVLAVMNFICIRGGLVRTLEVSWFSSASLDACGALHLFASTSYQSLTNHRSCSISLLVVHHISAEVEMSSLHDLRIRK
jgi:hypothetical protein